MISASSQVFESDHIGEFVQHHQVETGILQQRPGHVPGALRRRDIGAAILGIPGEAGAHLVERYLGAVLFQVDFLPRKLFTLDELDDSHLVAVTQGAHYHAECRARLALAVTGEQDRDPALRIRCLDSGVHIGLLLLHGGLVLCVFTGLVHGDDPRKEYLSPA